MINPDKPLKKGKKEINFKYNTFEYFRFLKKYKVMFLGLMVVVLLLEGLNLFEKFMLKIVLDRGAEYSLGNLTKEAFLGVLAAIMFAFIFGGVVKVISKWLDHHLIQKIEANLIYDLKKKYFNHLVGLSYNFHTTHKTGSLIARLSRGSTAVERMTDFIAYNTLPLFFQAIMALTTLWYIEPKTAYIIIGISLIFVSYSYLLQQKQRPLNVKLNDEEDIEKANTSDILTNIESVKYFGKEKNIANLYDRVTTNTREALLRYWGLFRWSSAGQSAIILSGTFLLFYVSIESFLNHEISLGTLAFIYTVYGGVIGPLSFFVQGLRGYYRSMADFQDLFGYGKFENEIKDKNNSLKLELKEGIIEYRDVSFKYQDREIISKFNLKINKNEKVAFVGHSGSGKTTLVRLLYRLYDTNKGEILIDGKNVKDFEQEFLRSELAVVPQECVLFDDSIYNNILFSRPQATRKEVMEAMKFAQLDKIISNFPKKENTLVGQRGIKLSGGEKQRVSIARAILANKKVLVLDEATSALDSQTEHDIQLALRELMKNRTSIIIAHRLSTVMHADKIVVLDKGKIVQVGTHNNLIRRNGIYKHLWNIQRGGYMVEDKE